MRRSVVWGLVVTMVVCLSFVMFDGQAHAEEKKYVIGISEPTFNHPIRQSHFWISEIWKESHPNVELLFMDGQKNAAKQIADVEDLTARQVDAIIIIEHAHGSTNTALKKAKAQGVTIICAERALSDDTIPEAFILSDDTEMGRLAGEYLAKRLDGKGKVVIIQAPEGVVIGEQRRAGFHSEIDKHAGIEVVAQQVGNWQRSVSYTVMENVLQGFKEIDAVYADNDEMGLGVLKAVREAGRDEELFIVSIDGQKAALESIMEGGLAFSSVKPNEFPEALDLALAVLEGKEFQKFKKLTAPGISKENVEEHYNPFALF